MSDAAGSATLEAAAQISEILEGLGVRTALIGAVALAVHGYVRGTQDLDLATNVDLWRDLRRARDELARRGFIVELREPDAEDPLGGVLDVHAPGAVTIQIVNYFNPWHGMAPAGKEAVETAKLVPELGLRVVDLPHLVALKLYAGGPQQWGDVYELLARHPEQDLEEIGSVCARVGLGSEWSEILKSRLP